MRTYLMIAALMFSTAIFSQSYKVVKGESKVVVQGTSTVHDWESNMEHFSLSFIVADKTMNNVSFKGSVKSIKSGKKSMDSNTYEAMKAYQHSHITFTGSGFKISDGKITGTGKLTIAGVTKSIPIDLNLESWSAGSYNITGKVTFKMSTFGIDPPTAVFGTIKTGDDVTIAFNFVVKS